MSEVEREIEVVYDSSTWVSIPRTWPHGGFKGARRWARSVAREVTDRSEGASRSQRHQLAATLTSYTAFIMENELRYLYLPDVVADPVLVRVQFGYAEGVRDDTLGALAAAADMELLEPPEMTTFTARGLGEGLRAIQTTVLPESFRYLDELGGPGGDIITVWAIYTFRKGPYDLRVSCAVDSLIQLLGLLPVLEELVHGIDVVPVAT